MHSQDHEKLVNQFMERVEARNPGQPDFCQAVREVAESVIPFAEEHPRYRDEKILERLVEPDRIIIFRVAWEDDQRQVQVNRGYRVQFTNAVGPYKGGLRFHPSTTLDTFKFLGFEQIFKNSLTGLPLGGGKGGSDFDPKGKSDREVMRFCQSFMTELARHIGEGVDVPAGDIGVGEREIGFLFGQYLRLKRRFEGALTGKAHEYGGSCLRPEATGYGCVYFAQEMLKRRGETLEGKRCVISGSGNVARHVAEMLVRKGAKVLALSDSDGFVHDAAGLDQEKVQFLHDLKEKRRGRISEYAERYGCDYRAGEEPWGLKCDIAFPSATQNEIGPDEARALLDNGCKAVVEGANMPSTADAVAMFRNAGILFGPAKAANAGGVAVSGMEMTQNYMGLSWGPERVEKELRSIMKKIHGQCVEHGSRSGDERIDYVRGANVAGFKRVADAMLAYGIA